MPSTITHTYFALDVLDKLKDEEKEPIKDNISLYKVTAQSMDTIGFYDVLKPYKIKSFEIRKFSKTFHKKKTGRYLCELTRYIKMHGYEKNSDVVAFLYGLITHYALDTTMHPYIMYKTGVFDKKNKETYKYNAMHHYMEQYFDNYMVEKKERIIPHKYKSYKEFTKIKRFSYELKETIDLTFKNVYDMDRFSKTYLKSIKDMYFVMKHLRYDPHGTMNVLYHIFDFIKPKSILNAKFLSYKYKPENSEFYLNNEHKKWYYSADNTIESNESFDDLYKKAIKKSVKMIESAYQYLYENKNINIEKAYGNLSYTTGLDLELKMYSRFFEN